MSACKGCGASIRWARAMASGKRVPLDAEPNQEGNMVFVRDDLLNRVQTLGPQAAEEARAEGRIIFMPHHATCPEVARFRK